MFWILAATYISAALIFAILGSGELQPWNNPVEDEIVNAEEGSPLTNETTNGKVAN